MRRERDTAGGSALVLRGFDRGGRLLHPRRTRTWHGMDIGSVASSLAREHGLEFVDWDSEVVGRPMAPGIQSNESDWAFLRRIAVRNGMELQVRGNRLAIGSQDRRPPACDVSPDTSPALNSIRSDGSTAEVVFRGAVAPLPGEGLRLRDCGPRGDGTFRVEETRFLLDGSGWTSIVIAERVA